MVEPLRRRMAAGLHRWISRRPSRHLHPQRRLRRPRRRLRGPGGHGPLGLRRQRHGGLHSGDHARRLRLHVHHQRVRRGRLPAAGGSRRQRQPVQRLGQEERRHPLSRQLRPRRRERGARGEHGLVEPLLRDPRSLRRRGTRRPPVHGVHPQRRRRHRRHGRRLPAVGLRRQRHRRRHHRCRQRSRSLRQRHHYSHLRRERFLAASGARRRRRRQGGRLGQEGRRRVLRQLRPRHGHVRTGRDHEVVVALLHDHRVHRRLARRRARPLHLERRLRGHRRQPRRPGGRGAVGLRRRLSRRHPGDHPDGLGFRLHRPHLCRRRLPAAGAGEGQRRDLQRLGREQRRRVPRRLRPRRRGRPARRGAPLLVAECGLLRRCRRATLHELLLHRHRHRRRGRGPVPVGLRRRLPGGRHRGERLRRRHHGRQFHDPRLRCCSECHAAGAGEGHGRAVLHPHVQLRGSLGRRLRRFRSRDRHRVRAEHRSRGAGGHDAVVDPLLRDPRPLLCRRPRRAPRSVHAERRLRRPGQGLRRSGRVGAMGLRR